MRMNRLYLFALFLIAKFTLFAQAPTATIVVPSSSLCSNSVYTFSASTTGSLTAMNWSVFPSAGVTITPNFASGTAQFQFSNALTYSVSLFVANSSGTFATSTFVSVFKSAKASYNASLSDIGYPVNLVLTNLSKDAVAFNWNFSGSIATQTLTDVSQSYTVPGAYSVELVAIGVNGCNDTLGYSFIIDDVSDVKLTNVFTPNNDGINDMFRPVVKGVYEMKVWVFDRWGVLMYNWNGIKGGWDGYTTSGIECPAGVYHYIVEAKGFDGKDYKLKSNLTLIR
jgi:gliding motility-associated-like protein